MSDSPHSTSALQGTYGLLLLPIGALLINAFVWGVSWWPFRTLETNGMGALMATVVIYTVAAMLIVIKDVAVLQRMLLNPWLWLVALGSGLTNATFNYAVTIGEVARVVLLFYLMPVWAALLARWILHEPLTNAVILRVAIALAGAMIVLSKGQWMVPIPRGMADWLAIIGGFSFALNNVMLRKLHAETDTARSFAMFTGGVVVAGLFGLVLYTLGVIAKPAPNNMAWMLVMGLAIAFLIANLALQYGATRLPANVTSVVMLSEIIFATVSAVLLANETMSTATLIGGGLIIAAGLLAALQTNQAH